MNPDRMRARGIDFREAVAASLLDFKLVFNKQATAKPGIAYANVAYARGECVEGVVYRLATAEDITLMDPFEGSPVRYSREVYSLHTSVGLIHAWVYVANKAMLKEGLLPERNYLNHLLAGKAWHSEAYHQRLLNEPCVDSTVDNSGKDGLIYNV